MTEKSKIIAPVPPIISLMLEFPNFIQIHDEILSSSCKNDFLNAMTKMHQYQ